MVYWAPKEMIGKFIKAVVRGKNCFSYLYEDVISDENEDVRDRSSR